MDRNVFSYANAFFLKGRGCHLYGSVLTEGGGSRKSLFLAWRMLTACHYSEAKHVCKQRQTWWEGREEVSAPSQSNLLPHGSPALTAESGSQTRNADPNWGLGCVWRRKTNWRVKIAVVQGSCAPLIPKAPLFYPASFTHTQTDTHMHTHKRAHIPTHRQTVINCKNTETSQSPRTFIVKLVNDIHPTIMMWICSGRRKERWEEKRYSLDLPWEKTSAQALGSVKITRTQLQIFRSLPRFCCKGVTIFGTLIQHLALCEFCS